jgi:hypothetical protein
VKTAMKRAMSGKRNRENQTDRRSVGQKLADHGLLEATILSGAIAGAVVGMAGGPPGIVVGSALGIAGGLLAGSALEDDASRTDARDKELDQTIGVAGGDLGAREAAVHGLTVLEDEQSEQHARDRAEQRALDAFLGPDDKGCRDTG